MGPKEFYSADEVASRLDLHVRTVRRFIREGKLEAVRIGKQYRIAAGDLDTFIGAREPHGLTPVSRQRRLLVSSTVDIEAIGPGESDRLTTLLTGTFHSIADGSGGRRVDCIYYAEQGRLRVVVNADLGSTSAVLGMLYGLLEAGKAV